MVRFHQKNITDILRIIIFANAKAYHLLMDISHEVAEYFDSIEINKKSDLYFEIYYAV